MRAISYAHCNHAFIHFTTQSYGVPGKGFLFGYVFQRCKNSTSLNVNFALNNCYCRPRYNWPSWIWHATFLRRHRPTKFRLINPHIFSSETLFVSAIYVYLIFICNTDVMVRSPTSNALLNLVSWGKHWLILTLLCRILRVRHFILL